MRRSVAVFLMLTVLTTVWVSVLSINPVKAVATIHIRSDGSIDPPSAAIERNGDIYTLTDNIDLDTDGVVIERDNMTLDGNGFTLRGNGTQYSRGVDMSGRNNITLRNATIRSFHNGIYAPDTHTLAITGNIIKENEEGILCFRSLDLTVRSNQISLNQGFGISILGCSNISIFQNNLTENWGGIYIGESFLPVPSTISSNNIAMNIGTGIVLDRSAQICNLLENNITENYNGVFIGRFSHNNRVSKNNITENTGVGITVVDSYNNSLSDNVILGNAVGISFPASSSNFNNNNTVVNNNITSNLNGISLDAGSNDTFRNNRMVGNSKSFGAEPTIYEDVDASNTIDGKPMYFLINKSNQIIPQDAGYVHLIDCVNITAMNLSLSKNRHGIVMVNTNESNIIFNALTDNSDGLALYSCTGNTVSENNITNNTNHGLLIDRSPNNLMRNNLLNNNSLNLFVSGTAVSDFINDVDASNTVNGNPVYYWTNMTDGTVPSDAGCVVLVQCTNITVQNLALTNNMNGILLVGVQNSTIAQNAVSSNNEGICLQFSDFNRIIENQVTGNLQNGITLLFSSNNQVLGNTLIDERPLDWDHDIGLYLENSSNNTIMENAVIDYDSGLEVEYSSNYNIIAGNNFTYCGSPVWFYLCGGNSFYHNNFVGNMGPGGGVEESNTWDDGYPSGGNYWSDYQGLDRYKGQYQNETGSDGLGDIPQNISYYGKANYPLMKPYPWNSTDIGIAYVGRVYSQTLYNLVLPLKTIAGKGLALNLSAFIMNYATTTENFSVFAYANASLIGSATNITVTGRDSVTLNFTWNTAGFAYENYTVSVYAEPLQGEIDIADNNYTCTGYIHVGVQGDISGPTQGVYDGVVNMRDINYMIAQFNAKPTSPNWNPNVDVNDDGIVNMRDIQIAILNFNKHE
ncbi:MAG TPA: NosD domain-containing protein [Patescibacteria group bacterium]|nr:NosD domain-containing protein [Patescibacteria group bacterium]